MTRSLSAGLAAIVALVAASTAGLYCSSTVTDSPVDVDVGGSADSNGEDEEEVPFPVLRP